MPISPDRASALHDAMFADGNRQPLGRFDALDLPPDGTGTLVAEQEITPAA